MAVLDWLLDSDPAIRWHFALEEGHGRPSRWNTLRASRVLCWYEKSAT